jgi:hypothetical protein
VHKTKKEKKRKKLKNGGYNYILSPFLDAWKTGNKNESKQ